jgi:hypothetical protein
MEKLADIFLFSGTILIAFEIVGDIGHLGSLITLQFSRRIKPLFYALMRKPTKKSTKISSHSVLNYVGFFAVTFLVLMAFVFTFPIQVCYFLIGRPLIWINAQLNKVYQKSLQPWKNEFIMGVRITLAEVNYKKKVSDKQIIDAQKKKLIPFLALIGVVFLTVGFVLQITE